MKAVQMDAYGGAEVLHLRDLAEPIAGPGEVVVEIHAASVNPIDWKIREGFRREAAPLEFPHVLGLDFSGVVRETGPGPGPGPGMDDFAPGDEVYGVTEQNRQGAYADTIAVDAALLARKPASLSHAEAAGLALVGLTALAALEETTAIKAGETVLVHAGAGGVGGFAVQYASHMGATVISTARAANHDYVIGLGAERVIDYSAADFATAAGECDVVFDTVGGDVQARSFDALVPGGRLVHIARGPEGFEPPRTDVQFLRPSVGRGRRQMERINELVDSGAVRPLEIIPMTLGEAGAAHDLSRTGHVRGKIVFNTR